MHTVGGHGGFGNITVLIEDPPVISLTDQLGCTGAPLGSVEGLQGLVKFGVVEITWEAAGGFWVGVGGPARAQAVETKLMLLTFRATRISRVLSDP
ncbi:MAG: hypothetical protein FRX49_07773 [Trebouxia sp. A1-2]|nr:MAG: hypothetical protein FRX49_07773 [Trebouxia sp. A1-2]